MHTQFIYHFRVLMIECMCNGTHNCVFFFVVVVIFVVVIVGVDGGCDSVVVVANCFA